MIRLAAFFLHLHSRDLAGSGLGILVDHGRAFESFVFLKTFLPLGGHFHPHRFIIYGHLSQVPSTGNLFVLANMEQRAEDLDTACAAFLTTSCLGSI